MLTSHLRGRRRRRIDLGRHVGHFVVDGISQDFVDDDGYGYQDCGSDCILRQLRAILIAYKLQKSFHLSLLPEKNSASRARSQNLVESKLRGCPGGACYSGCGTVVFVVDCIAKNFVNN